MKVLLTLDESAWLCVESLGVNYTNEDNQIQVVLDQIKYDPTHHNTDPIYQLCDHYSLDPNDIIEIEDYPTD